MSSTQLTSGTDQVRLRVLGGPGTRKTSYLIKGVDRLLRAGHDPERILVVTFTRTAARDLGIKLGQLKSPGWEKVHASTLHSFCLQVLRRRGGLDVMQRAPRLLLEFEKEFLVRDLPDSFGPFRKRKKRLAAFGAAWARLQSDEPGWPRDESDRDFKREMDRWLRFHEAMLVEELVPLTLGYLRNNPTCNERRAFSHVLVDEYQDLNKAEQTLIDLLAEKASLTVAGDPDQSIYRFKFAHPDGIIEFEQRHPGTRTLILSQSYRCPLNVIEMANELISNNHRPDPKRRIMAGPNSRAGNTWIVQWESREEEARHLAWGICRFIKNGLVPIGGVLVLTPRRVIGYAMRDELQTMGMPCHSYFAEEALETEKAQEAFTLLSLVADPHDRVALRSWLGFGKKDLRKNAYARLRQYCEESGHDPWSALEDLQSGNSNLPWTGQLIDRFQELSEIVPRLQFIDLNLLVDKLFPESDPDLQLIRESALDVVDNCADPSQLREELRIKITQPTLPSEGDCVRIMSLHKAKGLTADLVVVAGSIEGFMPYIDERLPLVEQERSLEEQRCLFYVAITRTTQYLILSSSTHMDAAEAHRMRARIRHPRRTVVQTDPSRFLQELGPGTPKAVSGQELLTELTALRGLNHG